MRVTTSQLRLFLQILDAGGLTNAARAAGTTQPAFSAALARFERDIGVKVFERGPTGLVPTPIGRMLESPARQVMADNVAMHDVAETLSGGSRGRISVALTQAAAHLVPITSAIRAFRDANPHVQVRLRFLDEASGVARAVDVGEANVGIVPRSTITPTLERVELPVQAFELAMPSDRPRQLRFADVGRDGVLPFLQTVGLPPDVPRWLRERGVRIEPAVVDVLPGMVTWLLEQGVGAALLPVSLVPLTRAAGGWSIPLPGDFPPLGERAALLFRGRLRTPVLDDFLDKAAEISEAFAGLR